MSVSVRSLQTVAVSRRREEDAESSASARRDRTRSRCQGVPGRLYAQGNDAIFNVELRGCLEIKRLQDAQVVLPVKLRKANKSKMIALIAG